MTNPKICALMCETVETEVKLQTEFSASVRRWKAHSYEADKWSVEGALKRCNGTFPLQKEEYVSIP